MMQEYGRTPRQDYLCLEAALIVYRGCQERLQTAKQVAVGMNWQASVDTESDLFTLQKHYDEAQTFADEHLFLLTEKTELQLDCDGRPIRTHLSIALGACKDALYAGSPDEQRSGQSDLDTDRQAAAFSAALRSSGRVRANCALAILYALPFLPAHCRERWMAVARRKLAEAQLVDPFTMLDPQFLRHYDLAMVTISQVADCAV